MKKRYLLFVLCAFFTLFGLASCGSDSNKPSDSNQVEEYTVTFNSKGGSTVQSQTVKTGGKAKEPTSPTRTGYDFKGWYKEESYTTPWKFNEDTVQGNTTLYAKWEPKETPTETYSITYVSAHGTTPNKVNEATALPETLPSLSETGWKFEGWYTKDNYEESSKAVPGATLTAN
ncbi:InlB B-repeat-containing protein, partial [bacterium]|nr:InlB B-repeat-containing protein [bacterium]